MIIQEHNPDFSKLLSYYQREMAYLLRSGELFGKAYPYVAKGLDFSHKGSSDPHVQRLLESFSFLTARLQMDIDDEASYLSSALLEVLYPQFVAPIPSCVMTQMEIIPDMRKQMAGTFIPPRTVLTTTSETGESYRFQTTMGEYIWPLEVSDISYERVNQYDLPQSHLIQSPWLLKLKVRSQLNSFDGLNIPRLKFHLNADPLTSLTLFRWLNTYDPYQGIPIFIQKNPNAAPEFLSQAPLERVGFKENEALVPSPMQLASAYRLLMEYFIFPQKFLFIDVPLGPSALKGIEGDEFSLLFALGLNAQPEKWPLSPKCMRLGSIPAVNLFFKTVEPIRLDHKKEQYRLVPDYRREEALEIHSILKVSGAFDMETPAQVYEPYFSYSYKSKLEKQSTFWLKQRTRSKNPQIPGTDVYLSFVDKNMDLTSTEETTIYAHTLCTNRRLAEKIPVNARLDINGNFTGISCKTLDAPTRSVMPTMNGETQWRLISHLSIDHLGLCTQTQSIEPLREMLRLYNVTQSSLAIAAESIKKLSCRQTIDRIGLEGWRGFVPLLSVALTVDDVRANTQGFFLLSMILHELFRLTAGFNTLIETQMIGESRGNVIKKWLPESGTAHLI
jgi:type VI secretion system protein ImpG